MAIFQPPFMTITVFNTGTDNLDPWVSSILVMGLSWIVPIKTIPGWWWLVAMNFWLSHEYWECHHPNWLSYFSGLKPPTRSIKWGTPPMVNGHLKRIISFNSFGSTSPWSNQLVPAKRPTGVFVSPPNTAKFKASNKNVGQINGCDSCHCTSGT